VLRGNLKGKYAKLVSLFNYLLAVAEVCTKLDLTIPWVLPTGLEVRQSYLTNTEVRLRPFIYYKNTFSIRVINQDKFNKDKQIRAFMPNLIHSLDAASLALLTKSFNANEKVCSIYTVHDCFAVTADRIPELMENLKNVYTDIYSENGYLKKLDEGIRYHIKTSISGSTFIDDYTIIIPNLNEVIKFPDVRSVTSEIFDTECLKKSCYLVI